MFFFPLHYQGCTTLSSVLCLILSLFRYSIIPHIWTPGGLRHSQTSLNWWASQLELDRTTSMPCLCLNKGCQAGWELCNPERDRSREYRTETCMFGWTRGEMIWMDFCRPGSITVVGCPFINSWHVPVYIEPLRSGS